MEGLCVFWSGLVLVIGGVEEHGAVEAEDDRRAGGEGLGGGLIGPYGASDSSTDACANDGAHAPTEYRAGYRAGSCGDANGCDRAWGGIVADDGAFLRDAGAMIQGEINDLSGHLVGDAAGKGDGSRFEVDAGGFADVVAGVEVGDAAGEDGACGDDDASVMLDGSGEQSLELVATRCVAGGDGFVEADADEGAFGKLVGGGGVGDDAAVVVVGIDDVGAQGCRRGGLDR